MYKVSADLGYSYFKGINEENKQVKFRAISCLPYIVSGKDLLKSNKNNDKLNNLDITYINHTTGEVNNYFIGEMAKDSSFTFISNDKDKWYRNDIQAIFHTGVALLLPNKETEVELITGLPLEQYKKDKKIIKEILQNLDITIKFNRYNYEKRIKYSKVSILPQGIGALYDTILDNFEEYNIPYSYVGLLDIGGKTTNYIVIEILEDGEFDFKPDLSSTIDIGMNNVIIEISKKFKEITGEEPSLRDIDILMKIGYIYYNGVENNRLDLSEEIDKIKDSIVSAIKNKIITSVWQNQLNKFSRILVAGGGGKDLYEKICKQINANFVLPEDPQIANARGYIKYLKMRDGQL